MRNETQTETTATVTNWAAQFKLALVVSLIAAMSAMLLAGYVAESTIIVSVIVAATAASWYQLEHAVTPQHARVKRR